MKKFLICVICLLAIFLGGYYAIFRGGLYIARERDEAMAVPFRVSAAELTRKEEDGQYRAFTLRGVDVSASMPGHYATQFSADEADYLRWFESIGAMGANAVRATSVMDDDFYNALYTYNTAGNEPLYLMQGTSVSDFANDNSKDGCDAEFMGRLIQDGRDLVDIIHGRKNIPANELRGSGLYLRDISPWVVGFLIGTEWTADTIAYTDHNGIRSRQYAGDYFAATAEATAFEAMLAQVMDEVTAYETNKYRAQRPCAFICDPSCDFLRYEPIYARQLGKCAYLDAEHIQPAAQNIAGQFAAYRLYDFCDQFSAYLASEQRSALAPLLEGLDTSRGYGGYLELLNRYHSMPVVAAGYGFSSSRGAVMIGQPPLDERKQGERLAEVSRTLEDCGWSGEFVSSWQDTWERRTWNTAFATIPTQNYRWHDVQTDGQGYGLMAFDPGEDGRVCILDGQIDDWSLDDQVLDDGRYQLSAQYDAQGLYLLIQREGLTMQEPLYVPIDISPEVGVTSCASPQLAFSRPCEFLLSLQGRDNSRLLVTERYHAARENFMQEMTGQDPFIIIPDADDTAFVPITMALANQTVLDVLTPETRALQRLGAWETGRLTYGCNDPNAASYNSLADFCYGQDCVEVRLPWLLLNVADPSAMQVHRDYYTHYGVETRTAAQLYLGVSPERSGDAVPMSAFRLKGWGGRLRWQERLKQSYYVLQSQWKGDGALAADSGD